MHITWHNGLKLLLLTSWHTSKSSPDPLLTFLIGRSQCFEFCRAKLFAFFDKPQPFPHDLLAVA